MGDEEKVFILAHCYDGIVSQFIVIIELLDFGKLKRSDHEYLRILDEVNAVHQALCKYHAMPAIGTIKYNDGFFSFIQVFLGEYATISHLIDFKGRHAFGFQIRRWWLFLRKYIHTKPEEEND